MATLRPFARLPGQTYDRRTPGQINVPVGSVSRVGQVEPTDCLGQRAELNDHRGIHAEKVARRLDHGRLGVGHRSDLYPGRTCVRTDPGRFYQPAHPGRINRPSGKVPLDPRQESSAERRRESSTDRPVRESSAARKAPSDLCPGRINVPEHPGQIYFPRSDLCSGSTCNRSIAHASAACSR